MPSVSISALLHISRSGLLNQQMGLDVTSHNIANLGTTGFKRSRAEFQELLNNRLETPKEGNNRSTGDAAGVILADAPNIFGQGVIQFSEYPWNMAIEGTGFFQIRMADGTTAYTRDGTFKLDGEGRLVNGNGHYFLPEVVIPPDAEETLINGDGEIMVRRRGEIEPEILTTIELVRFNNLSGLESIGENLYLPTDASGAAEAGEPGDEGFGQVLNHALERSNVDLSREIVDLISAQRAYSLMTRALRTTDEMMGMAAQLR